MIGGNMYSNSEILYSIRRCTNLINKSFDLILIDGDLYIEGTTTIKIEN